MKRKKILVLVDWFYPGYKAGGPIQSCRNFVHFMEEEYELKVISSDRDLGDTSAYPGVLPDQWNHYTEHTSVFYASKLGWTQLRRLVNDFQPDYLYLNSMFSLRFTVLPLLMARMGLLNATIVLAPRGMLKLSALQFKPLKKKFFLFGFRLLNIQQRVKFHATDAREQSDLKSIMGQHVQSALLANFPGVQQSFQPPARKGDGELRMIFVGRIHPIKNLHLLLKCLQSVKAKVSLTIVAALEDETYWDLCQELIKSLPPHISVHFHGNVPHDELTAFLLQHHLFVLPTQGENFGHAIFESLAAGRPVLISDQTPWKNLAKRGAGWDWPLSEITLFSETIDKVAYASDEERLSWCHSAWEFCRDFIAGTGLTLEYKKLFN